MRRQSRVLCFIAALCASPAVAFAQHSVCTGPWQEIGNSGVSVHFTQVGTSNNARANWTWCFRNSRNRRLDYMTFAYMDSDGEHSDILPFRLEPGKEVGGWAAFMSTGRPTRLWIKEIRWQS